MKKEELIPGRTYLDEEGHQWEFSRFDSSGEWAICHPPGEPDMQSSLVFAPAELEEA